MRESSTESDDTSYTSEETSESSSSSSQVAESVNSDTEKPKKLSITRCATQKIIIKYSATIEEPKVRRPIAVISTNSTDQSEYSESEEDETDTTETEEETESEEEEEESDSEETEVISNGLRNGYTNGIKKPKGYILDDFKKMKTIGKCFTC